MALRLHHYDWLETVLPQLWPGVLRSIIKSAQSRLFHNGVRGQMATPATGVERESLWLPQADLGFWSRDLQQIIIALDAAHPMNCGTYVPVVGDADAILAREPIVLCGEPNHWRQAKDLLPNARLPPVRLFEWGPLAEGFLQTELHARIHQKCKFLAFRRSAVEVGCDCPGAAP